MSHAYDMSGPRAFRRLLLVFALAGPVLHAAPAAPARTAFPGSIKEVPAAPTGGKHAASVSRLTLRAEESAASMTFEVALRMRSFDELQARVARGEQIGPSEMEARYFPLATDHERLVRWLTDQGLEITRTDANRVAVFGRGSVDAVGAAFQVNFARVADAVGTEYTSAVTAPSLPADLAAAVLGIHGLQPHIRRRPLSLPRLSQPRQTITLGSGYLPADVAKAYNANGVSATGAGQTIAIYALAYPSTTDLTTFWTTAGVSQSLGNVEMIDVAGGPAASPSTGTVEEATLDAEWASSLAPGAKIRIYGANENDPAENDELLQQVYADLPSQPTLHQLCICLGGNETEVERDYLVIEAQYMANLASGGVSVLVASGDNGANIDNVLQTTYPTSDPDVTGVGGTSLVLGNADVVTSETAWSDGGGGVSTAFTRPSWQVGPGVPIGNMRLVPDVAATADPNQGAVIIYNGNSVEIGGTSWAAPVWSAFTALLNQGRSTPLGLLNPRIYPLIGTASFRDITSGSNGYYSAGPGYDLCTGVGVPDVAALLAASLGTTEPVNAAAQTGSEAVTVGQPATFFVAAEGAAPLAYQWERQASGSSTLTDFSDTATYSGSKTATLVVAAATVAMSGDQFVCVITNASGSATTAPATLTVNLVGVTTLAGWPGAAGSADGKGWAARFAYPGSVRADGAGNLYVADSYNNTVRKVTPAGVVTTVAGVPGMSGSTDGPAATALFNGTAGVAVDSAGNLFVADDGNYTIREISAAGTVTTLAGTAGSRGEVDGAGSAARFYDPQNLAIDASGNLYVADGMGNAVRMVTPAGVVTTLAGGGAAGSADGTGAGAQFSNPTGIAVGPSGNIYVADYGNDTVRMVTPAGVVTTIAGTAQAAGSADGTGTAASFDGPAGLGLDSSGNLYVADSINDTIRMITPAGVVTTAAGAAGKAENIDGLAPNARFTTPGDVTVDSSGIVYVADAGNDTIRRVIPGAAAAAPGFTAQPASQTVNLGGAAAFSAGITGTPPFTFQWSFNGAAIPGATAPGYGVGDVQQSEAGSYTVTVSNSQGSATSAAATLTVALPPGYPDITGQPQGATLQNGGTVTLSVTVSGDAPFTYQWMLNGVAIAGATGASYTAAVPGSYTVAVTNAVASATSAAAVVGSGARLVNVSTRALVETGGAITIAGFVIEGPPGASKQVLVRGIGPALAEFSVGGLLAQPTISVYDSNNALKASNTGWGTNANAALIATVSAQVGAFALPAGSADCALLANLAPGAYTVQLSGVGSTTGVALAEVYETDNQDAAVLGNISTRAQVGTGGNILIAGFVVLGTQPATVLIRGVGPTLADFSVAGFLPQPILTLFNSADLSTPVATNAGWGTAANAGQMAAVTSSVGAFALPQNSLDSVILTTLAPGSYSAQVTGAGGSTGIALVEVYQVQP